MKHLQKKGCMTSMTGLMKVTRKVWRQITPQFLEKLFESMPRRRDDKEERQRKEKKRKEERRETQDSEDFLAGRPTFFFNSFYY